MAMRGEIRGFLTGLALVAGIVLLLASAPILLPGQSLLQSLRFHLGVATLGLVVALLLARALWRGLALGLLVLASLAQGGWILLDQQRARAGLAERPVAARFEVLSFNLLISNPNGAAIADMILERAPDVVMLFEAAPVFGELERLSAAYPYRVGCDVEARCDTLLLSRTALSETRVESLSSFSEDRVIFARTEFEGRAVNLVAVHLTKPYFDQGAEIEVARLTRMLDGLEGPVFLAGDFNAAPWSRTLGRLVGNAGLLAPSAYPGTWPVRLGDLGIPIDTGFTRAPALIEHLEALADSLGSNHRGVFMRVGIAD